MNMETDRRRDELLEMLWRLSEREEVTLTLLRRHDTGNLYEGYLREFSNNGLVRWEGEQIAFTREGSQKARDIVRRHRLAERLLVDVLGKLPQETEDAACEFEHILAPELVDAICTLLGHPMTCPHGQPIPEGICCQREQQTEKMAMIPLTQVACGIKVKIAAIDTRDPRQLNRLLAMGLTPGTHITLLQKKPALVAQVEQRQIAFEEAIGNDLQVWQPPAAASHNGI